MKKRKFVVILSGLLLIVTAISKIADHAANVSFTNKILRAYNVPPSPDALASTVVEARRVAYHYADPLSKSPRLVNQEVTVWLDHTVFRREKRDSQGQPVQVDLFDGDVTYRSQSRYGESLGAATQIEDWQSSGVRFNVLTFGIIPLLRQLQDSTAVYLGSDEGGQEKLAVRFASVTCTLYVDQQHLIRKVEMIHKGNFVVIEYDQYQAVGDIQLPFNQRLFSNGRQIDELYFTRYDLNPSLPADHFSRDALQ
jgi:hypothetical protein